MSAAVLERRETAPPVNSSPMTELEKLRAWARAEAAAAPALSAQQALRLRSLFTEGGRLK